MTMLYTVLAFVLALGPLIIIHELGHYGVARLCGVKVLRFSVGMGRVVWSRRFGPDQTEWAVSALPLGGYVKMLDARDPATAPANEADMAREFTRQNVWKRIAIVAAGPAANFLLAIAVLAGLYMHGLDEPCTRVRPMAEASAVAQAGLRGGDSIAAVNGQQVRSWTELRWEVMQSVLDKRDARFEVRGAGGDAYAAVVPASTIAGLDVEGDVLGQLGLAMWRPPAKVEQVLEGGAGERAGLRAGDLVVAVDGRALVDGIDLIETVRAAPGRTLRVSLRRDGAPSELALTPERDPAGHGKIGVMVAQAPEMVTVSTGLFGAIAKGAERTWETSTMTIKMIAKMIVGEASWKNVTGPITIADYAGQTARIGIVPFLQFIAFISISLGVMNLLPIPVLDGGHLLYYSLEVLTGRPVPERIGEFAQRAGVGLLFMLMALAVFNDLVRLL